MQSEGSDLAPECEDLMVDWQRSGGYRMQTVAPAENALVEVRGQRWVVSEVDASPDGDSTVLTLQSVEDGRYGETLDVVWEVEPGCKVLPAGSLPELASGRFDPPQRLAALLDA